MAPGNLSKILSSEGVLRIDTLGTILKVLGCRLSIEPLKAEETTPDIEFAPEVKSPKFANVQTQLAESDSSQ